ncbi:DUF6817 domain-containing protein [Actinophytocola xanthii]|uniref:DUF6817 domain-containing protein n=1 Tax=Actinophytocola xanthii TaxID=1912961 RepID=A0A1Q8CPN1_9PSEU|nr:hypothetical protein [Actinophytocola xanthii]OLF16323.1 hypothetical protein BU204_17210 [Actinophytocola xanthii]
MSGELERAEALLVETGAGELPHPGGTLLAHLRRVRELLAEWGAPAPVQLAGLCHAAYGTDGFGVALLDLEERARLVEAIGPAAESLVYLYGSCDRSAVYPRLDQSEVAFTDRFTGATTVPAEWLVRGFVEITAANELDVVTHNAELAAEHGPALHELMRRARRHLSPAAAARWEAT